jgi:hypothetical protein
MLAGAGKKGKTPTLLKVYERLSNNIKPSYYYEVKGTNPKDIECYPLYHHDKKVALCTAGDQWDYIKKSIIKFNCIGADVLIIAFNEDILKKEDEEEKLFRPDILEKIQPHYVIHKRVTGKPDDHQADEENNEKDCQIIIDHI